MCHVTVVLFSASGTELIFHFATISSAREFVQENHVKGLMQYCDCRECNNNNNNTSKTEK